MHQWTKYKLHDWVSETDATIKWKRVLLFIDKSLQWEKQQYKSSNHNLKVEGNGIKKKCKNTQ